MPYYPERKPEIPDPKQEAGRGTDRKGRLIRLLAVALSCLLIGYGGIRLFQYRAELAASRETSEELKQIHEQAERNGEPEGEAPAEHPGEPEPLPPEDISEELPTEEAAEPETVTGGRLLPVAYPDNPLPMISDTFLKLRQKGQYIVGWLRMDGVDEAVAQKDNTFFLKHDALGKRNGNGAIFLDEGISLRTRPYTLLLYGHNMKSGNMFGRLKKYKDSTYFYQHRVIRFDSMYEEGEYAVFAVMEMDTTPGVARWYDLWSLDTDSAADREKAIRTLERQSVLTGALDVRAEDQLLLLVTCLDGDTERLVVAARRLREDETPEHLTIR